MGKFRKYLRENKRIYKMFTLIYRWFGHNRIRGKKGNQIVWGCTKVKKTQIVMVGKENYVEIGEHSLLKECQITILGNQCHVKIAANTVLNGVRIWCEDDGSAVLLGADGLMMGNVQLAATEGKKIIIGNGFLFSDDICIRTGDSHSILNADGKRVNPAGDVKLGDHVWIGNQAIVLKGVTVGNNCVIGSGSVVTRKFSDNVAIAGNPAKIVKENIDWKFERV